MKSRYRRTTRLGPDFKIAAVLAGFASPYVGSATSRQNRFKIEVSKKRNMIRLGPPFGTRFWKGVLVVHTRAYTRVTKLFGKRTKCGLHEAIVIVGRPVWDPNVALTAPNVAPMKQSLSSDDPSGTRFQDYRGFSGFWPPRCGVAHKRVRVPLLLEPLGTRFWKGGGRGRGGKRQERQIGNSCRNRYRRTTRLGPDFKITAVLVGFGSKRGVAHKRARGGPPAGLLGSRRTVFGPTRRDQIFEGTRVVNF